MRRREQSLIRGGEGTAAEKESANAEAQRAQRLAEGEKADPTGFFARGIVID